jgi:hypothetical protein
MSRNQKLIVIGMAVLTVVVLLVLMGIAISTTVSLLSGSAPAGAVLTPTQTPTPSNTPIPTWTPKPTATPGPTRTPRPTGTPTLTPTETPTPGPTWTPAATITPTPTPKSLENPTFDDIGIDEIPGWQTGAFVNWSPGEEFNPATSFAAPRFHKADSPDQRISGSTLQIDTIDWVKLRAWVFQQVDVGAKSRVVFQVSTAAILHDDAGGYFVKIGVDPDGGEGCDAAKWSSDRHVNQRDGVVILTSPEVIAGDGGRVTVCMFAETQYAQVWHAVFFDDAELTVLPQPDV